MIIKKEIAWRQKKAKLKWKYRWRKTATYHKAACTVKVFKRHRKSLFVNVIAHRVNLQALHDFSYLTARFLCTQNPFVLWYTQFYSDRTGTIYATEIYEQLIFQINLVICRLKSQRIKEWEHKNWRTKGDDKVISFIIQIEWENMDAIIITWKINHNKLSS